MNMCSRAIVHRAARTVACFFAGLVSVSLCLASPAVLGQSWCVKGIILDEDGVTISGAKITVRASGWSAASLSDQAGKFSFDGVPEKKGTISVRAPDFNDFERSWIADQSGKAHIEVVLTLKGIKEEVTVTSSRTEVRVGDTPASVVVLTNKELATTAALGVDDVLRQVPGFSLFRRSGSRTANPSSQGVSLRGIGASGPSRAVVLRDGIPLNDPFGGWVYWDRVPRASISSIEVLRGGSSDLYGTGALSGVINILTRPTVYPGVLAEAAFGNQNSPSLSLSACLVSGKWAMTASGEAFYTSGYILVAPEDRGSVDTRAASQHLTGDFTIRRSNSPKASIFARVSLFGEARKNGTTLQNNDTGIGELALGGDWQTTSGGKMSWRLFAGKQVFNQTFSAVAADRNSEELTRRDRIPSWQVGASGQWTHPAGTRRMFVLGFETRLINGRSDQTGYSAASPVAAVDVGGSQWTIGLYAEHLLMIGSRFLLTMGLRADEWKNYRGSSIERSLVFPGPPILTFFENRSDNALSPRLSLQYRLGNGLKINASGYGAFRAPTLYELYRSFRVGDIVTLPNSELRAERLAGGELGVSLTGFLGHAALRATFFWSMISDPIANVTLAVAPDLITRKRMNLGTSQSRGLELEGEARLSKNLSFSIGCQLVDARVVSFSANPLIEGLRVPQVPWQQLTFQAKYASQGGWTASLQGRLIGAQFEDDRNLLPLAGFVTLDMYVARRIRPGLDLFASVENLLDRRYEVALTPSRVLGPPFLCRVGARLGMGTR
jgi:outer membrane receptor protein involved in Fe transport